MNTSDRIQKLGFKRWYERTLIEGHAYLVSSFLGMIIAFAGLELVGKRQDILFGFLAGAIGMFVVVFGFHRYYRMLILARSIGDHATCERCKVYAAFNVVASGQSMPDGQWLRVKCRKCGNEWTM